MIIKKLNKSMSEEIWPMTPNKKSLFVISDNFFQLLKISFLQVFSPCCLVQVPKVENNGKLDLFISRNVLSLMNKQTDHHVDNQLNQMVTIACYMANFVQTVVQVGHKFISDFYFKLVQCFFKYNLQVFLWIKRALVLFTNFAVLKQNLFVAVWVFVFGIFNLFCWDARIFTSQ